MTYSPRLASLLSRPGVSNCNCSVGHCGT